jgi:hypothetical protein
VGAAGVLAGAGVVLAGGVVCPERKEAHNRKAAARKNKGESPRGSKNLRIQEADGEFGEVSRSDHGFIRTWESVLVMAA